MKFSVSFSEHTLVFLLLASLVVRKEAERNYTFSDCRLCNAITICMHIQNVQHPLPTKEVLPCRYGKRP